MFGWTLKRVPNTEADKKLEEIKNILFPPYHILEQENEKIAIDASVDVNLSSVLQDIQFGDVNEDLGKSLGDIIKRVERVRKLLNAYYMLDNDINYLFISTRKDEEILPKEQDETLGFPK